MVPDAVIGYIAMTVTAIFFGSNFVPIRPYETRDGLFVQFIMSCAILFVGAIVNAFRGFPVFCGLSMLGGVLWATGNVLVVPIINMIGLSLGLLLWSSTNMLLGWASGRYGWFGLEPDTNTKDSGMNIAGVVISMLGSIIFIFIKSSGEPTQPVRSDDRQPVMSREEVMEDAGVGYVEFPANDEVPDRQTPFTWRANRKRIVGVGLALFAGCFFGLCFTPNIYLQQHLDVCKGSTKNGLDYVFGQFVGIFLACSAYFIIYAVGMRSRPFVKPELVLPSFACGLMWAIAQSCWFIANDKLGEPISFPINTRMPGIIAALWGVFYLKEIRGRNNYLILTLAMLVTIVGTVLTGLSKSE